ncbi:MAG: ABC transporter ATP-binding protein, partial [Bacilli bacterium]|nr:ABC transporter ATP-binding protein [Bacilli bacterium]
NMDNNNISADMFMKPVEALQTTETVQTTTSSSEDVQCEKTQENTLSDENKPQVKSWSVYKGKPRGDGSVPVIELENITHIFNEGQENEYRLFDNFNLTLPDLPGQSQIFSIMGQSGCGKSQMLMAIAGLTKLQSGTIKVNGNEIDETFHCPLCFQACSNYPWLTVKENVMLPMTVVNKVPKDKASEYADELLEIVGMTDHANKYPNKLSGGQQQRVALARCFATKSPIVFCDESTSKLDPKMKKSVQMTLLKMSYRAEFDTTCVCVTHDVSEAAFISNKVIILQANPCRVYKEIDIYYPGEEDRERGEWIFDTPEYANYVREISHHLNAVCS